MRTKEEIQARFEQQYQTLLKELRKSALKRCPKNCKWSEEHRVKGNGKILFCKNQNVLDKLPWSIVIAEESICGNCGNYKCSHTRSSVEAKFVEIIQNPARIGKDFPKLAVLLWLLNEPLEAWTSRMNSKWKRFWNGVRYVIKLSWW